MFQTLVQKGFLRAVPGPRGGYQLARSPDQITILSVIEAIDGSEMFTTCILGLTVCSDRRPCGLHQTWARAKRKLLPELRATTLLDLATLQGVKAKGTTARKQS